MLFTISQAKVFQKRMCLIPLPVDADNEKPWGTAGPQVGKV